MPWVKVDRRGLLLQEREHPCRVCGSAMFDPCKGSMRKRPYITDGIAYLHVEPVAIPAKRLKAPRQRGLGL